MALSKRKSKPQTDAYLYAGASPYIQETGGETVATSSQVQQELESATSHRDRGQYVAEQDGEGTAILYVDGPVRERVAWIHHETEHVARLATFYEHGEALEAIERAGFAIVAQDSGHDGGGCPVCEGSGTIIHVGTWRATGSGFGDAEEITKLEPCPVCGEGVNR